MNLIPAQLDHVPALLHLSAQFYAHFGYAFEERKHQKMLVLFVTNEHLGRMWLIESDGAWVGYLALTYGFSFEFGGRDAFVDELFVAESHRNRGLGRLALAQVQEKMPELGIHALHLQTEKYNERAKQLYQSLGFTDSQRSILNYR